MIKRIELINFMSHAHTVIEPADGLTVIVGDNNTGKSALISALQVLCRNAPGDYMVRHGTKECRIRVVTDDGHEIEWIRKGKVVSYRINGRDVHRLGGSVPEDLHELLRLPLVETENDPFDIHFGEQKKPIFLLNESPARRATFFASSSDTIKLIEMQGRHRKKIQEARAAETELARREAVLAQRRKKLAPVDALGESIVYLEEEYAQIEKASGELTALAQTILALEKVRDGMMHWEGAAAAVRPLASPPKMTDTGPLAFLVRQIQNKGAEMDKESRMAAVAAPLATPPPLTDTGPIRETIRQIRLFADRAGTCQALQAVAAPLVPPPPMADTAALAQFLKNLSRHLRRHERLSKEARALERLESAPELADPQPLKQSIGSLAAAKANWQAVEAFSTNLRELPGPPEMADVSGLASGIEQLASASKSCKHLEAVRETIRKEQEAAKAALTAHIEATGVCPTCGHDLDPEEFIERMPKAGGEGR